jgi:uncharacterized protein
LKLLDAHLHFFSWDYFQALSRAAARSDGKPEEILREAALRAGIELPAEDPVDHLQRWLAQMDLHGVDRVVVIASAPEEAEAVRVACADADDRLIPFTMVNPVAKDGIEFTSRAFQMGFRGILLFPALHHFRLDSEECLQVLKKAREARAAVIVQCGILEIKIRDLLGLPRIYDPRFADPLAVIPAANRFPEIPFIIPHFGAGMFRETLIAGAQCPNVHVDTSSSNGWMATQPEDLDLETVFRRTLKVFGAERILFGTDSTTFPRGWRIDVYRSQSQALERLGISIADRNLIFGENLLRLLGLRP